MKITSYKAIAEIVGCSPSMVSRVLNEKRNAETRLGKKIKNAHCMYEENLRKMQEADLKTKEEISRKIEEEVK